MPLYPPIFLVNCVEGKPPRSSIPIQTISEPRTGVCPGILIAATFDDGTSRFTGRSSPTRISQIFLGRIAELATKKKQRTLPSKCGHHLGWQKRERPLATRAEGKRKPAMRDCRRYDNYGRKRFSRRCGIAAWFRGRGVFCDGCEGFLLNDVCRKIFFDVVKRSCILFKL